MAVSNDSEWMFDTLVVSLGANGFMEFSYRASRQKYRGPVALPAFTKDVFYKDAPHLGCDCQREQQCFGVIGDANNICWVAAVRMVQVTR